MAIPNINISIVPVNQITLKSSQGTDVVFNIERLNDEGTDFDPYIITPGLPYGMIIPANGEIVFPVPDDLYRISFQDTVNPTLYYSYIILADQNIKACKRKLILKNLCSSYDCDNVARCQYLNERMKFYDLEMGLYYIYSKFIQRQSLTMLVVPTNQELLTKKDFLNQLLDMCSCKNEHCKDCDNGFDLSKLINSDCGCDKKHH